MEDAHTTKLDLDEDKPESDSNAFFAVYDGHGGAFAASPYPLVAPRLTRHRMENCRTRK